MLEMNETVLEVIAGGRYRGYKGGNTTVITNNHNVDNNVVLIFAFN